MGYKEWKELQDVERYAENRYRSWDQRWIDGREKKLVHRLFSHYRLSGTILDLPVGYGRFQPLLSTFGRSYTADVGFFPVLYEKERLGTSQGGVNCSAENLPFSDKSVDIIFCFRLMQHIHERPDRISVLKEFKRVSRKWVVVSVYLSSPLHQLHRAIIHQPSRITILTGSEFERELEEADLTLIEKSSVLPGIHAHRICLLSTQ